MSTPTMPTKPVNLVVKKTKREIELETEVAALKAKLAALPEPLTILPNGDLYRAGPGRPERPDNMRAEGPSKIDSAMANILTAAKGSNVLTCVWCGQQFVGEKATREHLGEFHKMAVKPISPEEAALAVAQMNAENEAMQKQFDSVKE